MMDSLSTRPETLEREKNVQHEHLQGRALWAAMGGTCLVVFVHFLDGSILGPVSLPAYNIAQELDESLTEHVDTQAIPNITDEFESLHDIGWYGSAYFITK